MYALSLVRDCKHPRSLESFRSVLRDQDLVHAFLRLPVHGSCSDSFPVSRVKLWKCISVDLCVLLFQPASTCKFAPASMILIFSEANLRLWKSQSIVSEKDANTKYFVLTNILDNLISIVFLADTPPTPSKKHPYIKLASTKKPKWHLGLFIFHNYFATTV